MFAVLVPDLPDFCVEQIERTEKGITITARAISSRACCPDCQQASSRVHSYYTRCPMDLPSSGRPISLHLHVRHFRCFNRTCSRKTFAEPLPDFLLPYAQRTSRLRESLRKLGEEGGGEAGARMSKQPESSILATKPFFAGKTGHKFLVSHPWHYYAKAMV